ncbi:sigma factor-like helix-turn-helix DNA-binding protein [Nocardia sp. NBC_01329]|uniref:sigma factor-like helix-turn-helix DNA-binding protein n=1 Tax=Nocardia sp. NBC_01329 TaxID=2903594 RepID=UPI002E12858A|nr:sigma-70 family RNA polymerase sigma factor [Nocardia sp. NBC_01329]
MDGANEFDEVRSDPDPVRRGQRATELITLYQQRATELARLRREAIEEAHRTGLTYTEIAERLGITKGRISQIRTNAPPPERAFFGVGPVAVGIPRRDDAENEHDHLHFDVSYQATRQRVEVDLARLSLASTRFEIAPEDEQVPTGDAVVICGPESAPVTENLLAADDALSFEKIDGTWCLIEKASGRRYSSPSRADLANRIDIGYLGRRVEDGRVIVHIAGMTSIGSMGVAHWLTDNVSELYEPSADFTSAVIECDFDTEPSITDSRIVAGPFTSRE